MKDNAVIGMLKALCQKLGIKANGGPGSGRHKGVVLAKIASEHATEMSHAAKHGGITAHIAAANAHRVASDAHFAIGDGKKAAEHTSMVIAHMGSVAGLRKMKGNESLDPETSWSPVVNKADGTQEWFIRNDGSPSSAELVGKAARTGGKDVLNPGTRIPTDSRGEATYETDWQEHKSAEDAVRKPTTKGTSNAFPLKGDSTKQTPLPSKYGHAQTDETEAGGERDLGAYDQGTGPNEQQEEAVRKTSQHKGKGKNAFPLKSDRVVANAFPNPNKDADGKYVSSPSYRAKAASDQAHEIGTRVAHEVAMGVHTEARNYHARMASKVVVGGNDDSERQKHIDAMIEHGRQEQHHKFAAQYAEDKGNRAGAQAPAANPHEFRRLDLMSGQEYKYTEGPAATSDTKNEIDSEQSGLNDRRQGGQLDGDAQGAAPVDENVSDRDTAGAGNIPGTAPKDRTEKNVNVGESGPTARKVAADNDKLRLRDKSGTFSQKM